MKRIFEIGIFSIVMVLTVGPTLAHAFNSAAHIYIVEEVFPDCGRETDLHYGSVAPDLALFVTDPTRWSTAKEDTHIDYRNLLPYARTSTQRAFAKGWLTHGLADDIADSYIASKTDELVDYLKLYDWWDEYDWSDEEAAQLAHHAIEKAIDLLLKYEHPELAKELFKAVLFRSWQDRFLLTKVFVWEERRTDWSTLAATELAFRRLAIQYAMVLALPNPVDKEALAELGVQLAREMFEIEVSREVFLDILDEAIDLCEEDYEATIHYTILEIRDELGLP